MMKSPASLKSAVLRNGGEQAARIPRFLPILILRRQDPLGLSGPISSVCLNTLSEIKARQRIDRNANDIDTCQYL